MLQPRFLMSAGFPHAQAMDKALLGLGANGLSGPLMFDEVQKFAAGIRHTAEHIPYTRGHGFGHVQNSMMILRVDGTSDSHKYKNDEHSPKGIQFSPGISISSMGFDAEAFSSLYGIPSAIAIHTHLTALRYPSRITGGSTALGSLTASEEENEKELEQY